MVKYCCNNFHALKITFANETARLCEALDVDPFQVMDLVCKDRQLNISPAYLKPGFAFGGSCLPKDLRATLYLAKTRDVELPMLGNVLSSNRLHVEHAIAKVLASGRRKVGMIGLSFKTGTDDLRESPLVLIAEQFIGKGLSLLVYDPEVHLSRLLGANRRFIDQHVPHIGSLMREDIESVIADSDFLVVGLSHPRILDALARHAREDQLILDLVNIPQARALRSKVVGLCW
jgi:GDP-mannose 6-dehydrogenase